ncbi:hypothetical protein KEM54_004268 [Ascosphaera aggregata]|nr:hypothetical protein KEM54_004268 [Ascosphaera aggregata]
MHTGKGDAERYKKSGKSGDPSSENAAYKETDGIRIKDRRVLVDVERGRTVKGWKPRRFGGGLGGRGYTKAAPARPMGPSGFAPTGPGFRGGFGRGGYRGGFNRDIGGRGGAGGGGAGGGMGYGGGRNGFGGNPPPNAPSGPGAGRSGGFGGYGGGGGAHEDRRGGGGGGGRFDRGFTGGNREPIRPRDAYDRGGRERDRGDRDRDRLGGAGSSGHRGDRDYRDRDRDRRDRDRYGNRRDDDYSSRKRYRDEGDYEDPRTKRRY